MKSDIKKNPYHEFDSHRYDDGALHLSWLRVEILACAVDTLWSYVLDTAPIEKIQEFTGTYNYRRLTAKEMLSPRTSCSVADYLIDVADLGPEESPIDEIMKEKEIK